MVSKKRDIPLNVVLVVLALLSVYPIFFMLSNALKSGAQSADPFSLGFAQPFGTNFVKAWIYVAPAFMRSVFIVVLSVAGVVSFGMLSSYAFARLKFPARNFLFYVVFALLLVPGFLTLIPLFLEIKDLGLLGSSWGLIFAYIGGGQAFAIFVLRSTIEGLPMEFFEAARMDGAGDWQVLLRIVVPLSVPIMVSVALINIINIWGDYILPSLILDPTRTTVAVAIANFQPPPDLPNIDAPNMQFAAFGIASVPVLALFLILLRYFVAGITSGGLKM